MVVPARYLCPMTQTRKRNLQLATNLGEAYIRNLVFRREFAKRKLPNLFIKFLPIPSREKRTRPYRI
jgi:hypothetical protein